MGREDVKGAVQQQFGDVAENYTTSAVHAKGADLQTMLECIPLNADMCVLDAGAGAGHTAMVFAPHVKEVIAYDLTPAMLTQVEQNAKERGLDNISTQQGDVENLPFDDDSFDVIVSRYSAHHWINPAQAVCEFARILKPNGYVIFSDIVASENPAFDTFLQALELLRDPSHVRDFSVSQWKTMFGEAGFEAEVVDLFDLSLDFENWIARMQTAPVHVAALRSLYSGASADIKAQFNLPDELPDGTFTFTIPSLVMRGYLPQ